MANAGPKRGRLLAHSCVSREEKPKQRDSTRTRSASLSSQANMVHNVLKYKRGRADKLLLASNKLCIGRHSLISHEKPQSVLPSHYYYT